MQLASILAFLPTLPIHSTEPRCLPFCHNGSANIAYAVVYERVPPELCVLPWHAHGVAPTEALITCTRIFSRIMALTPRLSTLCVVPARRAHQGLHRACRHALLSLPSSTDAPYLRRLCLSSQGGVDEALLNIALRCESDADGGKLLRRVWTVVFDWVKILNDEAPRHMTFARRPELTAAVLRSSAVACAALESGNRVPGPAGSSTSAAAATPAARQPPYSQNDADAFYQLVVCLEILWRLLLRDRSLVEACEQAGAPLTACLALRLLATRPMPQQGKSRPFYITMALLPLCMTLRTRQSAQACLLAPPPAGGSSIGASAGGVAAGGLEAALRCCHNGLAAAPSLDTEECYVATLSVIKIAMLLLAAVTHLPYGIEGLSAPLESLQRLQKAGFARLLNDMLGSQYATTVARRLPAIAARVNSRPRSASPDEPPREVYLAHAFEVRGRQQRLPAMYGSMQCHAPNCFYI